MHKKVLISLLGSALLVIGCDAEDNGTTGAASDSNGTAGETEDTSATAGETESETADSATTVDTADADTATTEDTSAETDTTDGSDTDTSDTSDSGISTGFITDPDGGGVSIECSVWEQDCGEAEKCAPWANDGGSAWNATRCVPIDATPDEPGDPCSVEGSGVSGIDSCNVSSMCWDVDGETNEGTCIAFCTGSENAPLCDNPDTSCSIANEGVLTLCLPICDPLTQDCAEGQACYPIDNSFVCAPDASGEDQGADNDPCEFINACDVGNICVNPAIVQGCPAGSSGCCQNVCDLTEDPAGQGCDTMETCEAWYEEGMVTPGFEDVGVCALPS
ncbi:MAG: ribulose phosphate epimerase [Nannocystaceae bacterium]|nr:ribulose phosphate epimerase [Nannocystaceae bacterium]